MRPFATTVRTVRTLPARMPLRVKLVAGMMLLVVLALAGSGFFAAATLRDYLINRVDAQLKAVDASNATSTIAAVVASGQQNDGPHGHGGDGDLHLPSAFVLAVAKADGSLVGPTNNLIDPKQPLPRLPTGTRSATSGIRVITVPAVEGDGTWRVALRPVTLTDGTEGTFMVAQSLNDVDNTVDRLTLLVAAIGAGGAVLLAGVGWVLVRASLRPLRDVERTAAKIAGGDLSSRVPETAPRTEVGQLSRAFNTMLERVEVAFDERAASEAAARTSEERMRNSEAAARHSEERMRRFVADASHELRTPLTSIRGFAELYRQGAAVDAGGVGRMMGRIESEAERMGLLVEDLLLLARLDQERPLARRPVDLLTLAHDCVLDARAVAPDRPVTLVVGPSELPPVVSGDEPRLRQVLANLLSNALRHTPGGTPVEVRVTTQPGVEGWAVVLEVADHGPGLTDEQAGRVFERFYRADAARSRDSGSTGLGLAIVAALVAGHAGTVTVNSAPGQGAVFRVVLPLADAEAGALAAGGYG